MSDFSSYSEFLDDTNNRPTEPSGSCRRDPFAQITEEENAVCERFGHDYSNPTLIEEMARLAKERERALRIKDLIDNAWLMAMCAHIAANPQIDDYGFFLESLGGEASSYQSRRRDVRKIQRLSPTSSMWVPVQECCEPDRSLLPLLKEMRDPNTLNQVTGMLSRSAMEIRRDVLIGSVGANAAIPAMFLLLTEFCGPDVAKAYAVAEGVLLATPAVPGLPGVVRALYMGLFKGIRDGMEKQRKAKKEGKEISLKKAIATSIALGSVTAVDLGYLMIPLVVAIRNFEFDIDARGMERIVRKGNPLYKLVKKYGKVEQLKYLAERVHIQEDRWNGQAFP
ncbi:MAG: hypothetical protein PHG63_01840 [Candidatus Dojkabacteria bacterium]|nr:hypothetical protein [Candidatus Dojkabacteria bacterium]